MFRASIFPNPQGAEPHAISHLGIPPSESLQPGHNKFETTSKEIKDLQC